MRNVSIGQIVILLIVCFLLFGDLNQLKKQIKYMSTKLINSFQKQEKKDSNP